MRKGYILKKIIILVLILALPGFLYYLLTAKGKNRYKPLPFYGPKMVAKTGHKFHGKYIPDTIYHKLSDFNLTDQNGKPVSFKNFDKKIFVASFFYTNCPDICSAVNKNISELVYAYRKNRMVYFTSITVDPERDTPPALKKYSSRYETTNKWLFLSGDTATTYSLARNGFLVNAVQKNEHDFIYSDKLILIDAEKRIRGYYDGTSAADITKLNDEIKVLIAEELRKVDKPLY
ncbi:SCO family protein [Mucilaginibacter sp. 14171R-50]|uniref:SCO family protein n=1 Tax=Mucilaginibacter sp. 14171R-50 TaxID=2703789 RepID=UPI00138CC221|nr:SCO family protein [Mucilaginibacter sp. 14171R-50]QHS54521.1 SCO family protein [Mucilaginibacter sp. 14171R-50]